MDNLLQHNAQDLAFIKDLRAELFDFSKRNQNIFFKGGKQFLELLDLPTDLKLETGGKLLLDAEDGSLLNALDAIRIKANRNTRELGFNQLNLVSIFVRWYHPEYKEHVSSPLLITPVELRRKKGISLAYELLIEGEPKWNPALLYLWKQLFQFSNLEEIHVEAEQIKNYFLEQDSDLDIRINESEELNDDNQWTIISDKPSIGNFDFRRMSLLQDYDILLTNPDLASSLEQRLSFEEQQSALKASYNVINADSSQTEVIESGLSGQNLVVQGPPGTGKSQTIVNLCSNLMARGKRVLLVSDKRAALDVVFSRLSGVGLDKYSLFSYDSQLDRKALINDLKHTYQSSLNDTQDLGALLYEKQKISEQIQLKEQAIQRYHNELNTKNEHGISLCDLFETGLNTQEHLCELENGLKFSLPPFHDFKTHEQTLTRLENIHIGFGYDGAWYNHPASQIKPVVWQQDAPGKWLKNTIDQSKIHLKAIKQLAFLGYSNFTVDQLQLEFAKASLFNKLSELGLYELADPSTVQSRKYDKLITRHKKLRNQHKKAAKRNLNWRRKLELQETEEAIQVFEKWEGRFSRFFSRQYRAIRKAVNRHYNFEAHAVLPSHLKILKSLHRELELSEKLEIVEDSLKSELGIEQLDLIEALVNDLRRKVAQAPDTYNHLLQQDSAHIQSFYQLNSSFERFKHSVRQLTPDLGSFTIEEARQFIQKLEGCLDEIPSYAHPIKKLLQSESYVAYCKLPLDLKSLKAHCIDWEIKKSLDLRYWLKNTTVVEIKKLYNEKLELAGKLTQANQKYLSAKQAIDIKEAVKLASKSVVGMDEETRQEKKALQQAKRLLEREFSKSKRYKSIRELLDAEAESLLMRLKPLWLMSPHAIADTFDIRSIFDVIIYDEASQARVEDAYPSLLRANQFVIFGDDKQMPPSNYFRKSEQEDLPESLLSYLAPKSVAKSLKWHYRSDSKELIEFSNQHFYEGKLHVIPSPKSVNSPVEFVYLENGRFIDRRNVAEAKKVVSLLKSLLLKDEKSIGIVAFSLEQAQLIEEILTEYCKQDPVFAELINSNYTHYDNGVYQGLFIKNLENIQGDERDVMIISSAYGKDDEGKLRQYYGPLTLAGGERRLNVLLTRAKKKVILISSLVADDIQSDKDGALAFKAFIQFSQLCTPEKPNNKEIKIPLNQHSEELYQAYSAKQWNVRLEDAYNKYCYPELVG